MKRYFIVAIAILIAVVSTVTVSAEDMMKKTDSLNITSEEKSQLVLSSTNAKIVKKYVAGFCFIFPETNSVDELIQHEEIIAEQYLIVESNNIVSYQVLRDNKVNEIDDISSFERTNDEDFIAKMNSGKNLLTILSTDIEVYSCNYFEDTTHLGSCIYYETNMGDYVYYRGVVSTDGKEYLFPANDFVKLIASVKVARSENADKDGGSVDIRDYMDISKYDMNSLSFVFETNNSANEADHDAGKTDRGTIFDNKFITCGVFSAVGIALLLMILIISKKIRNVSKQKIN